MNFTSPTTKEQMYDTLQQIFYFYRIRRESWENIVLNPLSIPELVYVERSNAELSVVAEKQALADKEREILHLKTAIRSEIATKTGEKSVKEVELANGQARIQATYNQAKQDYSEWAEKRGMGDSDLVIRQLNEYDIKKNQELNTLITKLSAEIGALDSQITLLNQRLTEADTCFDDIYEKEKDVKVDQMLLEQQKIVRDVFKYNNTLKEKIQKYDNNIIETMANLEVKYMQIEENKITKEQLVERGYYSDVIRCVCDYYNTLDPVTAYQDIVEEKNLAIYLEDFYQSIVYGYRCEAELQ